MFHTLITLAYIIPNIYVFLRIWTIFINKGYKIHYTIIYALIISIYPVSNLFSETDPSSISDIIITIANYILPFFLYVFLFVLVFDLLMLTNRLLKIVSPDMIQSTRFKLVCLSAILFLSITVVVLGVINFKTIRTSDYTIEIPRKYSKSSHLRIAFAADFHLKEETDIHFVERFANKIIEINPDIMLFGGDIVEGDREDENMAASEKILHDIKTRYGTYSVLGNHEYYGGQDKGSFFDKSGMIVLCDTIMVIDSSFSLGGRLDSHFKGRKSIENLLKYDSGEFPLILIDHRPTEIDNISKTDVDVQLAGHTHDGQLFPINLITNKIYELSWGHLKKRNTDFFVTSGISLWGPPVRTTGKSEIMVIDISFTGK
jgi:predicted MPP superfamily phosphohydrolase